MAETKDLNPRQWKPSDPDLIRNKVLEISKKGADNPMGQEPYVEEDPLEILLSEFDAVGMDWQENFQRQLQEEISASGESDG